MALTTQQKHELTRAGHKLSADIVIASDKLTDATFEHLRQAFTKRELIKIRIDTPDRGDFKQSAEQIAARVPCELVKLIGRVVLLYRPGGSNG